MEAKTAGGIYLPESSVKELNEARVLAVGPGGLDKDGKRIQPSVAPGDKVLIPQVSWGSFGSSLGSCWLGNGQGGYERAEISEGWVVVRAELSLTSRAVWWITSQGWR
jgi:hypothetical protein